MNERGDSWRLGGRQRRTWLSTEEEDNQEIAGLPWPLREAGNPGDPEPPGLGLQGIPGHQGSGGLNGPEYITVSLDVKVFMALLALEEKKDHLEKMFKT